MLETELPALGTIKLTQETDYPWDGVVRIKIVEAPETEFAFHLRIPGWADSAEIAVNGRPVRDAAVPGTYAVLKRRWSAGDVVSLKLPMHPRLMIAHPEVEEACNRVAVMRGPMVYCLESVDLPEGASVHEVHIPRDIELTAKFEPDLLGGLVVLEGIARRRPSPDWSGKLYVELPKASPEPLRIRLIPYYAWLNRGPSEMRVWLPLE